MAGRDREYDLILIDEAAFTKPPEMLTEIWPKSIEPMLLATKGRAYVFSTPDDVGRDSSFYAICNDPEYESHQYHTLTSSSSLVPPDELERKRECCEPRVFRQKLLAEFVDWPANVLFDVNRWFADGQPVDYPEMC